jgi:undecaprenyl diphosphate synthase
MHVALIMNGNGRWAAQRALPPAAGYAAGVAALRGAVESAAAAGVRTLTLYAICAPAGARPRQEIEADLSVLDGYLRGDARRCNELAVRISLIGNHERLCAALPPDCDSPEETRMRMHLRIVVDYSAHDHVIKTLWRSAHPHAPESFDRQLREIDATAFAAGAVDLLVRTGGGYLPERVHALGGRLCPAVLYGLHWPDFTARCLQRALGCSAGDSDTVVSIA